MIKKKRMQWLFVLVLFSLVGFLGACTHPSKQRMLQMRKALEHSRFIQEMKAADVQWEHIGLVVRIIIPVDSFFETSTAMLKREKASVLSDLAHHLKQYVDQHIIQYPIRVSTYTDHVFSERKSLLITKRYAATVVAFLRDAGFSLSSNAINTYSYGSAFPVATHKTPEGNYRNRRIVIELRLMATDVN